MNDLFTLILSYQGMAAQSAEALVLVFLRVGAAMAVLPVFGEQVIPMRIRLVLAIMFSAAIAPAVLPGLAGIRLEAGFAPEVLIGLAMGMSLRLFVLALMTGGSIISNATSLSQLFPNGAEPQPAIAHLLVMAGLALALLADLHLRLVAFLILSYDLLPGGHWPDAAALAKWGTGQISRSFWLAFMISMPFLIASLVYNIALGVINRAMPQLMVSLVGAPALSLGGLVLLALTMPFALTIWHSALLRFLVTPQGALP
jgi:flagellar biosynthesis protein FliR